MRHGNYLNAVDDLSVDNDVGEAAQHSVPGAVQIRWPTHRVVCDLLECGLEGGAEPTGSHGDFAACTSGTPSVPL